MASIASSSPLLQHSMAPTEMLLDGVLLCFMLPAIQPAESRSWGGPCEDRPPQADERASSQAGKLLLINNSCSTDFSAGYPATSGSISVRQTHLFT
jgi:hypothetical protein